MSKSKLAAAACAAVRLQDPKQQKQIHPRKGNGKCIMKACKPHHVSNCTRCKRSCMCTGTCYASCENLKQFCRCTRCKRNCVCIGICYASGELVNHQHHPSMATAKQSCRVKPFSSPGGTGRSRSYTLGRPHLFFICLCPLTPGTPVCSSLPLLGLLSLPDKVGRAPKHNSCSLCMSRPRGSEASSWCWCASEAKRWCWSASEGSCWC